ncbi:MAG TPA: FIST N-terminal domain-containing protein [Acidimicrobiales bacterium]|nr:FIST N-terminal domain-containing protein [Acidimicrobiales bacterium]
MPFAASLSEHPLATHATGEVVGDLLDQLGLEEGEAVDLAVVFVTAPHVGVLEDVASTVRALLHPRVLVGASAVSVLAGDHEAEDGAAVSMFAARWRHAAPVGLTPMRLDELEDVEGWTNTAVAAAPLGSTLLLLVDPFTVPMRDLLAALADARPDIAVVGGMASAAQGPGGNRLVLDGQIATSGAIGVLIDPTAQIGTIVSQGCRPIGIPLIVTRSERNVLYEIGGARALDRLLESVRALPPDDMALAANGLHFGRAVDESKAEFTRGDFVIRNVLGVDKEIGAVAVGDLVDVGTTVQFHIRDAASADEDLRALVEGATADGALLFTCNGRGIRFFGTPDHDAGVVAGALGHRAIAGMFCAGELGPVGGHSFLHGYTASLVLFSE